MAQFRATIEGQRGSASRLGSKSSGIVAKINGWNGGVCVEASHSSERDVFELWTTGGSNGGSRKRLLGYVNGKGEWFPADYGTVDCAAKALKAALAD